MHGDLLELDGTLFLLLGGRAAPRDGCDEALPRRMQVQAHIVQVEDDPHPMLLRSCTGTRSSCAVAER